MKLAFPFLVGILAFLWVPFDAIDSYRYYKFVDVMGSELSLINFVLLNFLQTFDFIYYLLFYFCIKLSLPVQLVTGISIGLLFHKSFQLIEIIRRKYGLFCTSKDIFLIRIFSLLSVSFITLFGIGRFVTATVFFVYAVCFLFQERRIKAYIFIALACFTHVGLFVYMILFYIGYQWNGSLLQSKVVRQLIILLVIFVGFLSFLWISPVLKLISLFWIIQSEYDYKKYFDVDVTSSLFGLDLGYGDVLMFFVVFIILTFALVNLSKYNRFVWVLLILYAWLLIAMGFSQMWIQRTILFLIPFYGPMALIYLSENRNSMQGYLFRGVLILSIIGFFINVYSYRGMWVFSWPAVKL